MASKNITIRKDVYERLKAHKRGDESFSEAIDRILHELDSDWRTNTGFLAEGEAADLESEVASGLDDASDSFEELGDEIDAGITEDSS